MRTQGLLEMGTHVSLGSHVLKTLPSVIRMLTAFLPETIPPSVGASRCFLVMDMIANLLQDLKETSCSLHKE